MLYCYSLQNKFVLRTAQFFFDNNRQHFRSHHEGYNGVRTSENGLFLYKSTQADSLLKSRSVDYFFLFGSIGLVTGYNSLLIVPLIALSCFLPRKLAVMNFYTFHAELLPHTEQVVFHKGDFFGKVRRIFVDIKNLEKIDSSIVPSKS